MLSILIPVLCVVAVGLAVLMGSAAKQAAIEREAAIEKITVFWYHENDTYLEIVRTALNARLIRMAHGPRQLQRNICWKTWIPSTKQAAT